MQVIAFRIDLLQTELFIFRPPATDGLAAHAIRLEGNVSPLH